MAMRQDGRIGMLDSFRFLASFSVVLYHFYSRWAPLYNDGHNYVPYGNRYFYAFKYCYLGVEFFFIISGFVICFTLERCSGLGDFFYKRFSRLFPPILLCSIITFLGIYILDSKGEYPELYSKSTLSFLPGLTFTPPVFWQKIFHDKGIRYINGSYWSLWIEVSFYVLIAFVFFKLRKSFLKAWFRFLLLPITLLKLIVWRIAAVWQPVASSGAYLKFIHAKELLFAPVSLPNYLIYFSIGLLFYFLFIKEKVNRSEYLIVIFSYVSELIFMQDSVTRIVTSMLVLLFALFALKADWIKWLDNPLFRRIGVISYTLYLSHEVLGILLINKLATISSIGVGWLPLIALLIFVLFSEISFRLFETPVSKLLKKLYRKVAAVKHKESVKPAFSSIESEELLKVD